LGQNPLKDVDSRVFTRMLRKDGRTEINFYYHFNSRLSYGCFGNCLVPDCLKSTHINLCLYCSTSISIKYWLPSTSWRLTLEIWVLIKISFHSPRFLLEPWEVRELYIRKTADLPLQLLVGTFLRFVAIRFYFLSETVK
jgi:hypothetical protein